MKFLKIGFLLVLLSTLNCQSKENISSKKEKEGNAVKSDTVNQIPYADFLKNLNWRKLDNKKKEERFFKFVNTELISYWKGTEWDFNGVTRTPKQGNIACGYFVTNTLTDFGLKIKRVWLAQQASSIMIKKICESSSIKTYSDFEKFKSYFKTRKKNEIFIVGLDYHTGYIVKEDEDIYFLHSYFVNKQGVIKEKIDKSDALKSSNIFVIGCLSANSSLFK